jgi:hypothetical protein
MTVVCEANVFLDSQVNELKVNNDEAEHKVKSIERKLQCEITAHLETKDENAFPILFNFRVFIFYFVRDALIIRIHVKITLLPK